MREYKSEFVVLGPVQEHSDQLDISARRLQWRRDLRVCAGYAQRAMFNNCEHEDNPVPATFGNDMLVLQELDLCGDMS
jgi:hypothetical protein